jgi:hypothetical protein
MSSFYMGDLVLILPRARKDQARGWTFFEKRLFFANDGIEKTRVNTLDVLATKTCKKCNLR